MNKENIRELISKLSKNFKNKEIIIIFNGAIEFTITMKNIRFFVTRNVIIIVDENDKEFKLDPFYIEDIKYSNHTITFEIEGDLKMRIED